MSAGRPRLNPRSPTKNLNIRVANADLEAWQRAARAAGYAEFSAAVRDILNEWAGRPILGDDQ